MVRKVTGYLLVAVALLAGPTSCVRPAYADEAVQVEVNTLDLENKVDYLTEVVSDLGLTIERMYADEVAEREKQELEEAVAANSGAKSDELLALESIDSNLSILVESGSEPALSPEEPVRANNATLSLSAYSNVNMTNNYAQMALGVLQKQGWDVGYVFLQDAQNAYTLVYGDLTQNSMGLISGEDCQYMRWYYVSQSAGYHLETGTADVTVSPGNYTVASTVGEWPVLGDGTELMRKEVAFYALVAAVVYCLHVVWSYCLRNHNGSA